MLVCVGRTFVYGQDSGRDGVLSCAMHSIAKTTAGLFEVISTSDIMFRMLNAWIDVNTI
jgi:hypothetical protein